MGETLSPKMAWCREHRVHVFGPEKEGELWLASAPSGISSTSPRIECTGADEETALFNLCQRLGARFYK